MPLESSAQSSLRACVGVTGWHYELCKDSGNISPGAAPWTRLSLKLELQNYERWIRAFKNSRLKDWGDFPGGPVQVGVFIPVRVRRPHTPWGNWACTPRTAVPTLRPGPDTTKAKWTKDFLKETEGIRSIIDANNSFHLSHAQTAQILCILCIDTSNLIYQN